MSQSIPPEQTNRLDVFRLADEFNRFHHKMEGSFMPILQAILENTQKSCVQVEQNLITPEMQDVLDEFLQRNPHWSQRRFVNAAIANLLLQFEINSGNDREHAKRLARIYLDTAFKIPVEEIAA